MKLAIQGCCHGELDQIYASVVRAEREQGIQVDALLLCGDFQAIRNHADLQCLAVPPKYRRLGSFHSYYSGEKVAPILTLVIGGNHEASNYMHELFHGGWLAPNIYYLGAAGAVDLNGLTIAGISGIFKAFDYNKGRFERVPYDPNTIRSCYHTRSFDVNRLKMMNVSVNQPQQKSTQGVDIVMSHDWPNTIEAHGDTKDLIKKKPFFKEEIQSQTLGSPPLMDLLQHLRPPYWFSAHLHVKFAAIYPHSRFTDVKDRIRNTSTENPEAIDIDLDDDAVADGAQEEQSGTKQDDDTSGASSVTRFLALHKCLPTTPFLQFLDIEAPGDAELEARKAALGGQQRVMPTFRYNKRWLAITRAFHPLFSLSHQQPPLPDSSDPGILQQIQAEQDWIDQNLVPQTTRNNGKRKQDEPEGSRLATPETEASEAVHDQDTNAPHISSLDIHAVQRFVRTAPAPFEPGGLHQGPPNWYTNPQTEAFCHFLGIPNKINPRPAHHPAYFAAPAPPTMLHAAEPHSAMLTAQDTYSSADPQHPIHQPIQEAQDPNALEIDVDDFEDEPREDDIFGGGVTTLSDDETNELNARWKEGTG